MRATLSGPNDMYRGEDPRMLSSLRRVTPRGVATTGGRSAGTSQDALVFQLQVRLLFQLSLDGPIIFNLIIWSIC